VTGHFSVKILFENDLLSALKTVIVKILNIRRIDYEEN
jgi:hypothetical protein